MADLKVWLVCRKMVEKGASVYGCGFSGFENLTLIPLKIMHNDKIIKSVKEDSSEAESIGTDEGEIEMKDENMTEAEDDTTCKSIIRPSLMKLLSLPVTMSSSLQFTVSSSWDSVLVFINGSHYKSCYSSSKWHRHFKELINKHCNKEEEMIERAFEINDDSIYALTTANNGYIISSNEGQEKIRESTKVERGLITISKLDTPLLHYCQLQSHCYCLTTDGNFHTCGQDLIPVAPPLMTRVRQVANGMSHALVLTETGLIFSLGLGSHGQLGLGDLESRSSLSLIEGIAGIKIKMISCGGWHCLVVSESGDMYSWGWNRHSQLGHSPTHSIVPDPTLIEEGVGEDQWVEYVSCGSRHSACITKENKCYVWGWNGYGQLAQSFSLVISNVIPMLVTSYPVHHVACTHWSTIILS